MENTRTVLIKTFLIFIVLQPLLDLRILYVDESFFLFGVSIGTATRYIFGYLIAVLSFLFVDKSKNSKIIIGTYLFLVFVFALGYLSNIQKFDNSITPQYLFSGRLEILHLLKMQFPFIVVYIILTLRPRTTDLKYVLKIVLFTYVFTIIFSNIFKVGTSSYTDLRIKGSIIDWFANKSLYSYHELATRGFFYFSNQVGATILLLFPVCFVGIFKRKNKWVYLEIGVVLVALFMVGTKVAVFGFLILFICLIVSNLVIDWERFITSFPSVITATVLVCVIFITIYPNSPAHNRNEIHTNVVTESINSKFNVDAAFNTDVNRTKNITDFDEKVQQTGLLVERSKIYDLFILERYPYQNDPDFWLDIMSESLEKRMDFRYIETRMVQRIVSLNDNQFDKLFGVGYYRVNSIFNLERDFVSQYYTIGIFGLSLFVIPYFLIMVYMSILYLKKKTKLTVLSVGFAISSLFVLGISYFSGNILDFPTITTLLGVTISYYVISYHEQEDPSL